MLNQDGGKDTTECQSANLIISRFSITYLACFMTEMITDTLKLQD